jgi:ubiquinone/menaquinone biosynthesis C-methylase UbiE
MAENNYFIDPENAAEMARLIKQDRALTRSMGGPLFEQPEGVIAQFHDVLDIGCGPGGWALDVAHRYKARVTGIDVSQQMIDYGNSLARTSGLHTAHFLKMNAREPLEFHDNSFDLVNARLMGGFMGRESWPLLLKECLRVLRPGGMIRLCEIEGGIVGVTNSAAVERISRAGVLALYRDGRSFSPDGASHGLTPMLRPLLHKAGYQQIQSIAHVYDWSAGTEYLSDQINNCIIGFNLLKPFLLKTNVISSEEFEEAYLQMQEDFKKEDFAGVIYFLIAWGVKK